MAERIAERSSIAIETVLDWAYCEAKVWWQTVGRSIEEEAENLISPRTGSSLLQEAIQGILKLGHKNHQKGNDFDFATLLGTLWKVRLQKWGLDHLRGKMAAYSVLYEELMARFGEEGDIRKLNGSLYDNPTWSHRWRDLAISTGLTDLRKKIDAEQHKAGLGKTTQDKNTDIWKGSIGLADAFARSAWIVEKNSFPLEEIQGIGEEVYVTLPHIKVGVTSDLILTSGEELVYEKHIYGIRRPRMPDLIGDYSIKALFSAKQKGSEKEASSVFVRHLMSGRKIRMKPRRAAGINEIESMASAVQRRLNSMDFSGPRMVNGWDACGNCDYKLLCFDGEGIMQRYNLPLSGRINLANNLIEEMSHQLKGYSEEQKEIGIDFARVFLPFIAQNPGMTKDQIDWLITGI
jgi:hypothetical protein